MKFSEVKENTWIRYKGHIYYVSKVHHDYVDVMSLNLVYHIIAHVAVGILKIISQQILNLL